MAKTTTGTAQVGRFAKDWSQPLVADNGAHYWPHTSGWAQSPGTHWLGDSSVNICWQDTTSNATYCSAASALSMT